jgi:hypothetical protein
MLPPGAADQLGHIRHAMRTLQGSTALVDQCGQATFVEPLEPFVAGLAADANKPMKLTVACGARSLSARR